MPLPDTYSLAKLAHLVAVVLFLGNVTFGLFWVAHAERTSDPRTIGYAMEGVIRSDRWFTTPFVLLIVIAGFAAAAFGGLRVLRVGWIAWSIGLFTIAGAVFGMGIAPIQRKIVALARADSPDRAALAAALKRWHLLGWASNVPLWIAFAMMVLKRPL